MALAVAVEELGAGVGVVVALEHHVDVIGVKDGGQLGAQDHAVGVGVVQAGAVDVLVDGHHPPGGVGGVGHGLFDGGLVLGHVVVVGVQHDEQPRAVGVVVVAPGLGGAVIGGVGVIEVVEVVGVQGVVVADGGGHGQGFQNGGGEIPGVLLLLGLAGLVYLVAGGDDEAQIRVLLLGDGQGAGPGEAVVPGGGVGGPGVGDQLFPVLGLALGGADLGIAHVEHLHAGKAVGGVGLGLGLNAVFLHGVVVGGVLLQTGDGDVVVDVLHPARQAVVHLGGHAGEGGEGVLIGTEVDHGGGGLAGFHLGVPGEIQLGLVPAGGEGHLGIVAGEGLPALHPGLPGGVAAGGAGVVVLGGGGQGGGKGPQGQGAGQNTGHHSSAKVHQSQNFLSILLRFWNPGPV